MFLKKPGVPFNDGVHINTVMQRGCQSHKASPGSPCWTLYLSNGDKSPAVCGVRIKHTGFNGNISPSSLSVKNMGNRPNGQPRRARAS